MASLRRVRALLSVAAASAVAWVPLGWLVGIGHAIVHGHPVSLSNLITDTPWLAITGAVCGFFSGIVIAAAERRRSFGRPLTARLSEARLLLAGEWGSRGGGRLLDPPAAERHPSGGLRVTMRRR